MDAYRVAYDGRPYHGFQRQPEVPTVEGALFEALGDLDVEFESAPPGYTAAGRTDAGVSALAQTIAFEAPDWLKPAAFSASLPDSIRVWARAAAPPDFHATHHATVREYTYHLCLPEADTALLDGLESALAGEHDFHNLSSDDTGTVRDLAVTLEPDGAFVVLTVSADGFPRQLVRRLATLVEDVLSGRADMSTVSRLLSAESVDGPDGVPPAPAYPLVLTAVGYDLDFRRDEEAVAAARSAFEERRRRHLSMSRVAGTIARGL